MLPRTQQISPVCTYTLMVPYRRESRYSRSEAIKTNPCKQKSECEKMAGVNFLASCLKIRIASCKARVSVHIMLLISKVHLLVNQSVSVLQSILARQDR